MKRMYVLLTMLTLTGLFAISGCDTDNVKDIGPDQGHLISRADIGLADLLQAADLTVTVTQRSTGYTATAKGGGTIPSGEYAGAHFQIRMETHYTGMGNGTLDSGSAQVKIQGERFVSVTDAFLESFCCGAGDLLLLDGDYIFTVYGQVAHVTATDPNNHHLFAALGNTAGTMNMDILDQSGTVVEPADPPHDPGIGLIEDFPGHRVIVTAD